MNLTEQAGQARQKGVTTLGLLVLGMLIGVWVLVIIKLVPVYIEDYGIKDVFEDYQAQYKEIGGEKRKIVDHFERGFQVNNIRYVSVKELEVEKKPKEMTVKLNYDVRVPLFYNIDIMLSFQNEATVPRMDGDGDI